MLDFGFYNMDCLAGMREFPDNYFELAVVDPPYGIKADKGTGGFGHATPRHYSSKWDDKIPGPDYFRELLRVSRNAIVWGGPVHDGASPAGDEVARMG